MRRLAIAFAALAALIAAFVCLYWFAKHPSDPSQLQLWLGALSAISLVILAFRLVSVVMRDDSHRVRAGRVLSHSYHPGHPVRPIHLPTTPSSYGPGNRSAGTPAQQVNDEWGLLLEDKRGRKSWVYFSRDVRRQYPIHSYYQPKRRWGRKR